MNPQRLPALFGSCLLLAATALLGTTTPAHADTPLPVRELNSTEVAALGGLPFLAPSSHPFSMAAAAQARAHDKPTPTLAVQRVAGGTASVYRGAPNSSVPLAPPMPPSNALLDFITTGDLAQTWATMTSAGFPYLVATGYGDFMADATASWTTRVTVPAGAAGREVVVRFTVPPVSVQGATEDEGRARWRARLRAELMVNGFPAWAAEAIRFTTDPNKISNGSEVVVLQEFGSPLGFPSNDEDLPLASGGLNNDTSAQTINSPAPKKTVHLTLGRFNAGTVIDLAMVLRATATSVPASNGGTDHRCKWSNAENRYFCSRGTVSVNGATGEAPRIYLLP